MQNACTMSLSVLLVLDSLYSQVVHPRCCLGWEELKAVENHLIVHGIAHLLYDPHAACVCEHLDLCLDPLASFRQQSCPVRLT